MTTDALETISPPVSPNAIDTVRVAQDLQLKKPLVEQVAKLLAEGNSVPFIARYRKDRHGGMPEAAIRDIAERLAQCRQFADRKQTILKSIESQGKLTEKLKSDIEMAEHPRRLEDLYVPYKPRKRPIAVDARDKGLEPLAAALWVGDPAIAKLDEVLPGMVDPEKKLNSVDEVLAGAKLILTELIADHADVRAAVRRVIWDTAKLTSGKHEKLPDGKGLEYKDYFQFTEPVQKAPPHRILALNRGERENALAVKLEYDMEAVRLAAQSALPTLADHVHRDLLVSCVDDALARIVLPALEREVRRELTEVAQRHAIDVFARNLRGLLMQPPLRGKRVLAIDPGFRTGCRLAALDEHGALLEDAAIYPHAPQRRIAEAKLTLEKLIRTHQTSVIAIGNGTACRETEEFIAALIGYFEKRRRGEIPPEEPPAPATPAGGRSATESVHVAAGGHEGHYSVPESHPLAVAETMAAPAVSADFSVMSTHSMAADGVSDAAMVSPQYSVLSTQSLTSIPIVEDVTGAVVAAPDSLAAMPVESLHVSAEAAHTAVVSTQAGLTPGGTESSSAENSPAIISTDSTAPLPMASATPGKQSADDHAKIQELKATVAALPEPPADLAYVIVNEAGASDYSSSPVGREEFPGTDTSLRATVSIGRRLQDPLSELVKIDPQHVGVGLYQYDVHGRYLKSTLEGVIESCVNHVGVNLNTAGVSLLRHVAGLNALIARDIVDYRMQHGPFRNLEQLASVPSVGPQRSAQAAGFLKIEGSDEPLDATWIHPENYEVSRKILGDLGFTAADLFQPAKLEEFRQKLDPIRPDELARQHSAPEPLIWELLDNLVQPGRDPREDCPPPVLRRDMLKLEDMQPGMELRGTVLNVVDFGAFIDVGLKDSGLVHISQLANRFVRSPHEVVTVGDVVTVWVMTVDQERRRVSLTMIAPGTPKTTAEERQRSFAPRGGRQPQPEGQDRPQRQGDRPRRPRGGQRRQPAENVALEGADAGPMPPRNTARFERKPRPPKPLPTLTKEKKEGKAYLNTLGELEAFFKAREAPPPPPPAAE